MGRLESEPSVALLMIEHIVKVVLHLALDPGIVQAES